MIRFIFFFYSFTFVSNLVFCQLPKSNSVDSLLTKFELSFKDSIFNLNNQNKLNSSSKDKFNQGLVFFNNKNFKQASIFFTNAIDIDSTFSLAYFYRARCYEYIDVSLASYDYRISYELDSSNFSPLYALASMESKKDIEEAINIYRFIISNSSAEADAFYELGVLYYIKGDLDSAIKLFTNSILIKKTARTFNDRASCYRLLEKNDLAIKDYLTAIALNSNLVFIYNNLASTFLRNSDTSKALAYYSLAIAKDSSYVLAYNNRASLYIALKDFDNALIDLKKAILLDANYAPAYNNKGVVYHNMKNYSKALGYFDKSINININYAKAYMNRGITRQLLRDEYGACFDWMKAKELGIEVVDKYLGNDCN